MDFYLSPNHGPRYDGALPDMVVIHFTATKTAKAAAKWLCNTEAEVSAHYMIAPDGEVLSLVPEVLRAWHAGVGSWGSVTDVNSRSIGIELVNTGETPFAAAQMDALVEVLRGIKTRWAIRPERVIGHSDMAPERKSDPGPRFDWRRLALENLSIWPNAGPRDANDEDLGVFEGRLTAFGYTGGDDFQGRLASFRMRFRPRHVGPLDATDLAMITDLARRFPVDENATWA